MKIARIISQHRRDFIADFKCEFCDHELKKESGYDDRYFHDEVIPKMICGSCGKSTESEGGEVEKTPTKYPEDQIV